MLTELQENVIYVADELEAMESGEGIKCPHCGTITKASLLLERHDGSELCTCPSCGREEPRDEWADVFPADWLCENGLDVEYRVSSSGDYLGARVYVTLGGPTIWIETDFGRVCGAWGAETCDYITEATALDALCRENFEMLFER